MSYCLNLIISVPYPSGQSPLHTVHLQEWLIFQLRPGHGFPTATLSICGRFASPRIYRVHVTVLASLPKPSHERHMAFWYTPAGDGWSLPAWRHQPSCTALVVVQVQGRTPPIQPRQLLYQATAAPIHPSIHPALRRKPNALPARAVSPSG